MEKVLHAQQCVWWNYLSSSQLPRLHHWSLGSNCILWWVELLIHSGITMLIHVSRRGPRKHVTPPSVLWHVGTYPRLNCNNDLAKTPWMDDYNQQLYVDIFIAQIGPLSFQAAIEHKPKQVRWGGLHASVVTEWWPACLHKQFPSVHHRGN